MTRTATLAGLAVLAAFAFAGAAGAAPAYACTTQDPSDCPTYTVPHHNNLTVSTTRGTITSDPAGISCPSDCAEDYEYDDCCTDLPRVRAGDSDRRHADRRGRWHRLRPALERL